MRMHALFVAFFLLSCGLRGQFTTFYKSINTTTDGRLNTSVQLSDGGHLMGGYIDAGGINRLFILRCDKYGNRLWAKYNTSGTDELAITSMIKTQDGNIVFAGGGNGPIVCVKIDTAGNILWQKAYDYTWNSSVASVIEMSGGGFMIAGTSFVSASSSNIQVIRTDANGDPLWSKYWGGSSSEYPTHMILTSDGNYVLLGHCSSCADPALVIKMDISGTILWKTTMSIAYGNVFRHIRETSDGGFMLSGKTLDTVGVNTNRVLFCKIDPNGNILSAKRAGTTFHMTTTNVCSTADGGVAVTGTTLRSTDYRSFLLKMDANLNLEWCNEIESPELGVSANSVQQCSDLGFLVAGTANHNLGTSSSPCFYLKTDATGSPGCYYNPLTLTDTLLGFTQTTPTFTFINNPYTALFPFTYLSISEPMITLCSAVGIPEEKNSGISFFPNPVSDNLSIDIGDYKETQLEIYSITGLLMQSKQLETEHTEINVSEFTSGIYVLKTTGPKSVFVKKFVKK